MLHGGMQVVVGDGRECGFEIREARGRLLVTEAAHEQFLVDIQYVLQHRTTKEEASLVLCDALGEGGFNLIPDHVRHEAVVRVHNVKGPSTFGLEVRLVAGVGPHGCLGSRTKKPSL